MQSEEVFEIVSDSAKVAAMAAKSDRVRVVEKHVVSSTEVFEIRQGDVMLYMCEPFSDDELDSWERTTDMQLAPGSSKGSRHIMEDPSKVEIYITPRSRVEPLVGPRLRVLERTLLTHPDHNLVSLPAGDYYIRFQRDLEREEIERLAD